MGIRAVIVGLASLKLDPNKILSACNISREVVDDPDGRIKANSLNDFWNEVQKHTDENIALKMAKIIPIGTYQTFDYLFMISDNLEEAINRYIRYYPIVHSHLKLELVTTKEHAIIKTKHSSPYCDFHHVIEFEMAILFQRIKAFLNEKFKLSEIQFNFNSKNRSGILEKYFGCPVKKSSLSQLSFPISFLSIRNGHSDAILSEVLTKNANESLKKIFEQIDNPNTISDNKDHLVITLKESIKNELKNGKVTLEDVAKTLGSSPRTLQRQLKNFKLSYSKILTDVRIDISTTLLKDNSIALSEIAYLLGFSESSAFHRAFKKWHNCTPLEFRSKYSLS